jgi:hypothetical protein
MHNEEMWFCCVFVQLNIDSEGTQMRKKMEYNTMVQKSGCITEDLGMWILA